jgi:hypothetical protein
LLEERRHGPNFDEQLWRLLDTRSMNLRNLSLEDLEERWVGLTKNVLYLVGPGRDMSSIERRGFSSWWWLRSLVQTEAELERRGAPRPAVPDVPEPSLLRSEFTLPNAESPQLWSRIGEERYLINTLEKGEIRFRAASSYDDASLNPARRDRELEKARKRPGQALEITGPDGRRLSAPIGDVTFSALSAREIDGQLQTVEYWLSSWSCDFDPRLFAEFSRGSGPPCDAAIVVWNMEEFGERIARHIDRSRPDWSFADFAVHYFDPYDMQPESKHRATTHKDFTYGYQRELRLGLMPPHPIDGSDPIVMSVGNLSDIAALYHRNGQKLAGSGPNNFLQGP